MMTKMEDTSEDNPSTGEIKEIFDPKPPKFDTTSEETSEQHEESKKSKSALRRTAKCKGPMLEILEGR